MFSTKNRIRGEFFAPKYMDVDVDKENLKEILAYLVSRKISH